MNRSENKPKAFTLSLIAGIFIVSNTVLLGVATTWFPWIIPTIPGTVNDATVLYRLTAIGLIFGVLVSFGAIMLHVKPGNIKAWGIVIVLFSIPSYVTGGGFIIGGILGMIGGAKAFAWKPKMPTTTPAHAVSIESIKGRVIPDVKVLIVYGTRWGGTVKVAEKIGETLKGEGYSVDIFDAKKPPQVDPYDLIIVGSGISGGKWTKEAEDFLQRNAAMLRVKKTALFVSCGMVERERRQDKAKEDYLVKVSNKYGLTPIGYGFFGGVLDFKAKYNILDRILVNSSKSRLKKMGIDISKPYDFRDWNQIEAWTRDIAGGLLQRIEVV